MLIFTGKFFQRENYAVILTAGSSFLQNAEHERPGNNSRRAALSLISLPSFDNIFFKINGHTAPPVSPG